MPASLTTEIPWLSKLTDKPIEVAVKGTFDEPEVALPDNQDLLNALATRMSPTPDGEPESLPLAVLRLMGGVREFQEEDSAEGLSEGIFGLIRSISAQREAAEKEEADDETANQESTGGTDGRVRSGRRSVAMTRWYVGNLKSCWRSNATYSTPHASGRAFAREWPDSADWIS